MPRTPRLDYSGAIHHAFNRGASHAVIFLDRKDCEVFLEILARLPARFGVRVLAFALMSNHYHLVLAVPRGNLSDVMRYLLGVYVRRFNDRHGRDGSPFRGRFSNRVVETEDYLRQVTAYVHLNPVRAGLVTDVTLAEYTSHRAALGLDPTPAWLDVSWVDEAFGGPTAFARFVEAMEPTDEPCPPPSTEELSTPGVQPVTASSVAEALARAASVAGVRRTRILSARGRAGQLTAWTLASSAGLTHRQAATVLGISQGAVSRRVRRFEAWCESTNEGARWREAVGLP